MKKKRWLILILLLIIGYLMGPRPSTPFYKKELPAIPEMPEAIDAYIAQNESLHKVKPGNEARIIWWNDSTKEKTPYSIVYLHGFTASHEEGAPVHRDIAKLFGCNLYLARLAEHGLDTVDALRRLTADKYWESAKEAFAIGKNIGEKVILMGTSTGGTNALQLAAAYPGDVHGIILLSPNIEINDPNAWLLNDPWGLQIATLVKRSRYITTPDQRDIFKKYWYSHYRMEGVVALEEMLETSMLNETFKGIQQPLLLLYYYKDEENQDKVVRVSAMKEMFAALGTPDSLKRETALPNTGDHVIASPIKSKDVESVQREIEKFLSEIMHLPRR